MEIQGALGDALGPEILARDVTLLTLRPLQAWVLPPMPVSKDLVGEAVQGSGQDFSKNCSGLLIMVIGLASVSHDHRRRFRRRTPGR